MKTSEGQLSSTFSRFALFAMMLAKTGARVRALQAFINIKFNSGLGNNSYSRKPSHSRPVGRSGKTGKVHSNEKSSIGAGGSCYHWFHLLGRPFSSRSALARRRLGSWYSWRVSRSSGNRWSGVQRLRLRTWIWVLWLPGLWLLRRWVCPGVLRHQLLRP